MKRIILGLLFSLWTQLAVAGVTCTLPFNLTNGTTADATQVMANYNALVTCLGNAAKSGVNTDITALNALSTPVTPLQGGANVFYGSGGGTANAQTVPSVLPATFTLTAGYSVIWVPSAGNTGATTLAVAGTAATAVISNTVGGVGLIGGEILASIPAKATYNGTSWVLDTDPMVGFGLQQNLASATTTDLGTALSHTVNITGTTTITSFGSSATTRRPLYKLTFASALTLTYNATSLILPGTTNITTAANDSATALYLGSGNWQIVDYTKASGGPTRSTAPTLQIFTTVGSGTYTPPAGVRWIRARIVGGGGGGSGGNNSVAGTSGSSTTFSTLTGGGGTAAGGPNGTFCNGGAGGTSTGGDINIAGGQGSANGSSNSSPTQLSGGSGGGSYFTGPPPGGAGTSGGGAAGPTNSGAGGGGGSSGTSSFPGCGGGAGGYVEKIFTSPSSVSYVVGAGGGGSAAGATAGNGGGGAAGIIIVEEYY